MSTIVTQDPGSMTPAPSFYEFFAGGGMARAGLGNGWTCLFANDFSTMKAEAYCDNWGADHFKLGDVAQLGTGEIPGRADLIWASFPCQDLSLAGNYQGLGEASARAMTRSGTFWPFWGLITALGQENRAPAIIVLENVVGAITSQAGRDFEAICTALSDAGYYFGAMVIDARHFVPQSRPRLFFIAVATGAVFPATLTQAQPDPLWHPPALCAAQGRLNRAVKDRWLWWSLAPPSQHNVALADLIEETPTNCSWHTPAETRRLLGMMNAVHQLKVEQARASGQRTIGAVYKRTRSDENGLRRQRAEVRFDGIAGCLRTPGGGSSRQTLLIVENQSTRSRLLSPREAARLMGLDEDYTLPTRYNDAYHLIGDGVCVPVVRHLAAKLLEPIIACSRPHLQTQQRAQAA